MNIAIINYVFSKAANEDYLKIEYGNNRSIEIKKQFSDYKILGRGYYLELQDKPHKETHYIKTDVIDSITIIKPKFKPIKL